MYKKIAKNSKTNTIGQKDTKILQEILKHKNSTEIRHKLLKSTWMVKRSKIVRKSIEILQKKKNYCKCTSTKIIQKLIKFYKK